jgi:N-acetylmuramoyl-L-alanine amidase
MLPSHRAKHSRPQIVIDRNCPILIDADLRLRYQQADITLCQLPLSIHANANAVRAQLPYNIGWGSWWVGNRPASIRLGKELNLKTCLLVSDLWDVRDLDHSEACIPDIIAESFFHFSEEILQDIAKPIPVG